MDVTAWQAAERIRGSLHGSALQQALGRNRGEHASISRTCCSTFWTDESLWHDPVSSSALLRDQCTRGFWLGTATTNRSAGAILTLRKHGILHRPPQYLQIGDARYVTSAPCFSTVHSSATHDGMTSQHFYNHGHRHIQQFRFCRAQRYNPRPPSRPRGLWEIPKM